MFGHDPRSNVAKHFENEATAMRKALLGLILIGGLSAPVSADAADGTVLGVGTGAVAGAVVAGPIGAVVGAVAGGVIGANSDRRAVRRSRRARAAYRRRYGDVQRPAHLRLAERSAPSHVRPVSSETATEPNAPGASGEWRDPD